MGIKKMFKKKDPTEDELRAELTNAGITTRSNVGAREEKFGAFRQYAQERQSQKPGFAPVNPYANVPQGAPGSNPYASGGDQQQQQQPGGGNPYGQPGVGGGNPYGPPQGRGPAAGAQGGSPSPYGQSGSRSGTPGAGGANPYGGPSPSNPRSRDPYGSAGGSSGPDPYSIQTNRPYDRGSSGATRSSRRDADEESVLDLNALPTDMPSSKKPIRRPVAAGAAGGAAGGYGDNQSLDLNALPEEDDLNIVLEDLPEEQQVNSEDEEVEAIRQDIRFVKQESVASTRNTLRMAQEADASATNTMGMLGSQSERLYNAEQNLLLADTQTNIAQDKVEELRRLNRSIFIPATNMNPFNKKSKLRAQESKLKSTKAQEKYLRETNRQGVYESEQRIKEGLTSNAASSDLYQKYKGEKSLEQAQRYQFENDSEDDEMEKELASNLDQIALFSKKLQSSARTMGQEVDSQNDRLRKIEDDADRLDINVHMNSTRLSNIR